LDPVLLAGETTVPAVEVVTDVVGCSGRDGRGGEVISTGEAGEGRCGRGSDVASLDRDGLTSIGFVRCLLGLYLLVHSVSMMYFSVKREWDSPLLAMSLLNVLCGLEDLLVVSDQVLEEQSGEPIVESQRRLDLGSEDTSSGAQRQLLEEHFVAFFRLGRRDEGSEVQDYRMEDLDDR
jgi:hypothetical protein